MYAAANERSFRAKNSTRLAKSPHDVYLRFSPFRPRSRAMSVSSKHILQQGPVIGAFLQSAVGIAKQSLIKSSKPTAAPTVPGPVFEKTTSPLPAGLIQDYSRHVGADPGWYRSTVPAHLFPQWVFPLSQKTLKGLPYPIEEVMNGGCRLEINGAIP